jgi:hypothetical protein
MLRFRESKGKERRLAVTVEIDINLNVGDSRDEPFDPSKRTR